MKYLPYDEIGNIPNIIVDGAPNAATLLTLSHWPHSGTPWLLKADLSAQIAFRYLDHTELHVNVDVVSNNHFDEDGLVSVFVMVQPELANRWRELLIDVAAAGDFGTYRFREAARIAFVIGAFAEGECSELYQQMLQRLPGIIEDPAKYREYYEAEEAKLTQSEADLKNGRITIEEVPALDLAIVRLSADAVLHPLALHNSTNCFRILSIHDHQYEFRYRYETWVQYVSKRPIARVDLTPLAERFSNEDRTLWQFDGVDAITASLAHSDQSSLDSSHVVTEIRNFLAEAPPAWNPFDPK